MQNEETKKAFDRDGFGIVRRFLDEGELAELTGELSCFIRQVVPTMPDADAFYQDRARPETLKQINNFSEDSYFNQYLQHPKWIELADVLVGEPLGEKQYEWFNKPPGTNHYTPPHQDNYYFKLKPAHVVTIWLALDTVNEQNGCLRYVSGSHLEGLRPHDGSNVLGFSQGITDYGSNDQAREVQVFLRPGDAVAHHGMAIHRADANHSKTNQRRAFVMVGQGVSCRPDKEAVARHEAALKAQHEKMGLKV